MGRIFGRCKRCRDVTELYRDGREYRCQHCIGRSYENVGRPSLPHDGQNRLCYDIDMLYSEL